MKAKITARLVPSLKPGPKPYEVVDEDLAGFILRIQPGGAMVYYASYRLASGRRNRVRLGSASVLTPAQARDLAKTTLASVTRGEDPADAKREARAVSLTLGEFLSDTYGPFIVERRKAGRHTLRRLQSAFSGLLDRPLTELAAWDLTKWRAERSKRSGSRSAGDRDVACLKAAMSFAVEHGHLSENPFAKVKLTRTDRRASIRAITPEEEAALWRAMLDREEALRAARARHNLWLAARRLPQFPELGPFADFVRPLVTLLLHTGLRKGEALQARWRDVDLDRGTFTVLAGNAKSGRQRVVPLNRTALETLRVWREQTPCAADDALVFPSPRPDHEGRKGGVLDNLQKTWVKLLKDAGVAHCGLHCLRHTFATRALAAGADVTVVQAILGHTSILTTSVYLHSRAQDERRAVEALDSQTVGNVVPFPASDAANGGE